MTRAASEPADEPNLVIDVEGRRFYWEFRYPDGRITYDTMVVPVDRTVELNVTAPDFDVIHSWWIPALGGKIDAIPGKLNHTWFRAESSGDYEGNCAEFCGLQHAEMTMIVRAVDAGGFEAELARLAGSGQAQFEATCAKCHNLRGPQLVGPTLGGNPTLADREALETLLREGRGEMPAIGRDWTDAAARHAVRVHAPCGRRAVVAVRAEPIYPVPWYRGRFASWLVTTDHKRIGVLYIWTSLVVLPARRSDGAADPHRAADARDRGLRQPARRSTSSSRCTG